MDLRASAVSDMLDEYGAISTLLNKFPAASAVETAATLFSY